MVYALYGLTDEEIAIVESSVLDDSRRDVLIKKNYMGALLFILIVVVVFCGGGWLLGKMVGNSWRDEDENLYK
jgi:Na+/citrate or Na+/malate symporter